MVREKFWHYYPLSDHQFAQLWDTGFVVLDANVLLNFHRYGSTTRDAFLDLLKRLGDRLWVPHQAALEYQRSRVEVIATQWRRVGDLLGQLDKARQQLRAEVEQLGLRLHPVLDTVELHERIDAAFDGLQNFVNERKDSLPDLRGAELLSGDEIRDRLTDLLDGKVGEPYASDRLTEIFTEGKARYRDHIPPGYEDGEKPEPQRYGDLLLWYQVIDEATNRQKPVVLLTDERKADWWSKSGNDIIGPRPELLAEMKQRANCLFWLYRADRFLELSRTYLKEEVSDEAIEEVQRVQSHPITAVAGLASLGRRVQEALSRLDPEVLRAFVETQQAISRARIEPESLANLVRQIEQQQEAWSHVQKMEAIRQALAHYQTLEEGESEPNDESGAAEPEDGHDDR